MKNIRDGDLYKTVTVFGKSFSLYYGYYDDEDRNSRYAELMPIYPDFTENPIYADDGHPFATEMQDVCEHYDGKEGGDSCYSCRHFKKGKELIGLCLSEANKAL